VDILFRSLKKHGFGVAALHGDLDQSVRTETLDAFRRGETAILVASDVAARGLDIDVVSHVFNFDVPMHAEDYVHRIGRTGRAGRTGKSFTLATPADVKYVAAIERLIKKEIPRIAVEGLDQARLDEDDAPRPSRSRSRGRGHERAREKPRQAARSEAPAPKAAQEERPRREERAPERKPDRKRDQDRERDTTQVVAFGSHVPDFMRRPAREPAKSEA
jgi:superfamily II DNA/RNA helicase